MENIKNNNGTEGESGTVCDIIFGCGIQSVTDCDGVIFDQNV